MTNPQTTKSVPLMEEIIRECAKIDLDGSDEVCSSWNYVVQTVMRAIENLGMNLSGGPMTKHTPTPWKTEQGYHGCYRIVRIGADKNEGDITDTCMDDVYISEPDAAFIVRACNCHDELVDALESALRNVISLGTSGVGGMDDWPQVKHYRAVLAKAKGE